MPSLKTHKKHLFAALLAVLSIIIPAASSSASYRVSGIVDFSYTSRQSSIGGTVASESTEWQEHYGLGFGTPVLDPRFLRLDAGVDYTVKHLKNAPDTDLLAYRVSTVFFPARMITWSLYSNKSVQNIPSTASLTGYDVAMKSYGGSMNLNLSKITRPGNRNNNYQNNNNNNNAGGFSLPLPDVLLTSDHTEVQAFSQQNPLHETRDSASADVIYRPSPLTDLKLHGKTEQYENLLTGASYDTAAMDASAATRVGKNGDLKLTGRSTTRNYDNTYSPLNLGRDRTQIYTAQLDLPKKDSFSQLYRASYSLYETIDRTKFWNRNGTAQISYEVLRELKLRGTVGYAESSYVRSTMITSPTPTFPETRAHLKSGSLSLGLQYYKEYKPERLDPFVARAGYDLDSGYSEVSDNAQVTGGNGYFYVNRGELGLRSSGWKFETIDLSYSYANRRDHAPLSHNMLTQTYYFTAGTTRIPKTRLNGSVSYQSNESNVGPVPNLFTENLPSTSLQMRTLTYSASLDHELSQNLNFTSGANRTESRSGMTYTLATIPLPSSPERIMEYYHATLNARYFLGRTMQARASAGETWTTHTTRAATGDTKAQTTGYIGSLGLNWRIRAIIIDADYRWTQTMPDNSPRMQEQFLFVKASRPF